MTEIEKLADAILEAINAIDEELDASNQKCREEIAALLLEVPVEPGDDAVILGALEFIADNDPGDDDGFAQACNLTAARFRLRSLREGEIREAKKRVDELASFTANLQGKTTCE